MLHICRDFITLPSTYQPQATMYLVALFMRTVLLYSVIGHTNFALDGVTFTPGSGTAGSISAAGGFTNRFTPDGYTVSSSDINRILAIRSTVNPLLNSGLWRVTGVDTANNQLILGLRGEPPLAEAGLTWRVHASETSFSFTSSNNANTTQYRGRTSGSTTSRIIMQSNHASAYQVRLTYEAPGDVSSTGNVRNQATAAPGFGGDSIGDFPVAGLHLHGGLYYNTASPDQSHAGLTVGINGSTNSGIHRFYIWGEDSTGTVVTITRNVDTTSVGWSAFGLPEDEEYPNDTIPVRRLFAWGNGNIFNGQGDQLNWTNGSVQQYTKCGVAYGYSGQPIFCSITPYCYASGQQSSGIGPRFSANASDNPFLGQTELQTVDLVAGTWDYGDFNGQVQTLFLEPRRMGRFPIARLGRTNFGNFSTTTDGSRTWLHTNNGIYLPWYGSILP